MKVLISAYTGLGNFILKTPMIQKIGELWPEAQIDIIAGNNYGTEFVLKGSNLIHETHILNVDAPPVEKLKFFFSLRKLKYDAVLLPLDAAPKFLMFGALLIGGTKYAHINFNLNQKINQKFWNFIYFFCLPGFHFAPWFHGRHEIDLNYDLLEPLYARPMERTHKTFIQHTDEPDVLTRFKIKPRQYIVIQPSAANGGVTAKVWAPNNFKELVAMITNQYPDLKVVFVGDRGDLDSIQQTPLAGIEGVVNTIGLTSIAELSTIINNSALVVAHDSGIMHIADALQANLIALYGPTDFIRTRPLGTNSHILFSKNECLAAHYNLSDSEDELAKRYPNHKCMGGITVRDVMSKITELLAIHYRENSIA